MRNLFLLICSHYPAISSPFKTNKPQEICLIRLFNIHLLTRIPYRQVSQDLPEDTSRRRQSIVIPSTSLDKCESPTFVYYYCTIIVFTRNAATSSSYATRTSNELCDQCKRLLARLWFEGILPPQCCFLLCNVCCNDEVGAFCGESVESVEVIRDFVRIGISFATLIQQRAIVSVFNLTKSR